MQEQTKSCRLLTKIASNFFIIALPCLSLTACTTAPPPQKITATYKTITFKNPATNTKKIAISNNNINKIPTSYKYSQPPFPQRTSTEPSDKSDDSGQQLSLGIQQAFDISDETADRLAPIIIEQANQYDISPFLIAAVIMQESSYRSNARSSAGAVGLTQVIPKFWRSQCDGSLRQEYNNIKCGTYILSTYNKLAGNWLQALAYYNVGPQAYKNSPKMQRQGLKYARSVSQYHQSLLTTLNLKDEKHINPIDEEENLIETY